MWPRNLISSDSGIIMGLLESPINTNKPYQWISTIRKKLFGLVEICCKHTLLNAQMACLFFWPVLIWCHLQRMMLLIWLEVCFSPPPLRIYPGCCAGFSIYAQTLPSSQQFPNWLLLYRIPGGSILFSGVKQIQNKLVRSFSYFTSSRKKEVCGRFNIKGTAVVVFFFNFSLQDQ